MSSRTGGGQEVQWRNATSSCKLNVGKTEKIEQKEDSVPGEIEDNQTTRGLDPDASQEFKVSQIKTHHNISET